MHNLVKSVFSIVGAMFVSLLLFTVVFGETGERLMWNVLEPIYQTAWEQDTYNEGNMRSEIMTTTFDSAVDISE